MKTQNPQQKAQQQNGGGKESVTSKTEKWKVPNVNNRKKKNEQSLRDPRVYNKISNLHFIGIPEGKEKEDRAEEILEEIMTENASHLAKDRNQI